MPGETPHQNKPPQPAGGPEQAVLGVALLLGVGGALLWFSLGAKGRIEAEYVLWDRNAGPLLTTVSSLVALVVLLGLASRKRSVFLTTAVESAHAEFTPKVEGTHRRLVYAPQIAFSLVGLAIYAVFFGLGDLRWLFFGFLARPDLGAIRGLLVLATTLLPAILIPTFAVVFLNVSSAARLWRASLVARDERELVEGRLPDPGDYQASSSAPAFLLGARESKESLRFEPDEKVPSWVLFEGKMIFGGLIIFGEKGSGKTALIQRILRDAIRYRPADPQLKCSICVIDQKGDLSEFVAKEAAAEGRASDVVRLGVDSQCKWNPFASLGPHSSALDCRQVGYFMRCAMSAGAAAGEHSYWQDNADNLIFRSVHLLALAGEAVGFTSTYQLITSLNAEEQFRDKLFKSAEHALNLRETLGAKVDDAREELRDTERYFEHEFTKLDAKVKTTVINVVSNFFQKFMAAPYARSFGCKPTVTGHFAGFRDLIASGKIFLLDVRSNEHGTIANALSMLVKLNYQAAVKTRDRSPADDMRRVTVLILDEAQSCITPSTANTEGDDKYLETSRSFRAVDVFATQQYSSFVASVGRDMAQRMIGSFNSIISYRHNDPAL